MSDWIEWSGGKAPELPKGVRVDIRFRTGAEAHAELPSDYEWDRYKSPAFPNGDAPGHIMAYRVVKPS